MKNDSSITDRILPVVFLLISSPVLLAVALFFGIFNLSKAITVIFNPFILITVAAINVILFLNRKNSSKNIMSAGIVTGVLFWLIGIVAFFTNQAWFCGLPIIGGIFCGSIVIGSILFELAGFIIGTLVISSVFGGILKIFR